MIIGTVTLLVLLFGGGALETFFIDDMNKGVKQFVIGEDRKKEILADLKGSEKMIKEYNKQRKLRFKEYKKLNVSHESTSKELTDLFIVLMDERGEFQNRFMDDRIAVSKKIKPDEWTAIIEHAGLIEDKNQEKLQKKIDKAEAKGKEPFEKTREAITKNVLDAARQQLLLGRLDAMLNNFNELAGRIGSFSAKDNGLLVRQDASKEEMKQVAGKINELRYATFNNLVGFHMVVKENTDAPEREKIMKKFNNDMSLTVH